MIEHETKGRKGTFYVEAGGERRGELAYFMSAPSEMTIYHTEVGEEFRGKGVGRELVAAAVEFARINQFKIVPTCPYADKIISETPEFQSLRV